MKKREIDILNECIERLLQGETVEQCLSRYPEQAAELELLLKTAMAVKTASAIKPRPEFRAKARAQFHQALREMEEKKSRWSFAWRPQWAITVLAALAILFLGGGTVAAAGYSMPDSPLYPLKQATEQVQLTFTFSELDKAELYAKLADKRVDEIIYMAYKGDSKKVETLTANLDTSLARVASLAGGREKELAQPAPSVLQAPTAPQPMLTAPAPPAPEQDEKPKDRKLTVPAPEKAESAVAKVAEAEDKAKAEPKAERKLDSREKLKSEVERNAEKNLENLRAALNAAPESAKPALRQAIEASEKRYQKALEAVESGKTKK